MQLTITEENYLKAIFSLSYPDEGKVSTNAIAGRLETTAASVTDMMKKLADKKLVTYEKYKGVSLTKLGKKSAIQMVRNHRIWEVFLVNKLGYKWDEVHEVAEQLEHIQSDSLVKRLDKFLDFPKVDPHGDPIPDENGNLSSSSNLSLLDLKKGEKAVIVGVNDTSSTFLQYLNQLGIALGLQFEVSQVVSYDQSMEIITGKKKLMLSKQVAENLWVKR